MCKSVIVMETPESCDQCLCVAMVRIDGEYLPHGCKPAGRHFSSSSVIGMKKGSSFRPGWCPLRDLPEYKLDWRNGDGGYESGWNDCLDKVTGGRR